MTAWIVRGGLHGEREPWALDHSFAGGGFHEVPDLAAHTNREAIASLVGSSFPADSHPGRLANYTGQMLALRTSIVPGDVVVMPMKTRKRIAIGICVSGYQYRADEPDPTRRHTIGVNWANVDVSRGALKDDLLNTVNGAMTIFRATKNNAEARLRAVMETGVDPGSAVLAAGPISHPNGSVGAEQAVQVADVTDPTSAPTLQAIRDRVRTHLIENFGGHKLTHLIADILRTEGYTCDVSPEGPDFGVDIIAGRGPLGLDSPTLIVEVKSEAGQIGAPVVRGLQGAMASNKADQGLLVAWGGLNKQVQTAIRTDRLTIRVWDSEEVLDHLFAAYERLPDASRSLIPLKKAWVLDEDSDA
ncbi:restriction endonuclease [Kribbella sp. VKM Ac-2568]|uniref:restriction endonuclease n=1 Tax=Kribbella sp. VKM Ac-2568 TaxID=2512219 RepID=UPI001050305B|nr:restriction endonuclease [Kribbella sp. VKM Ac-2568]TCM39610.1 restriction system protein [Kribbella sp. VKM Ac-2568]